MCMEIQDEVFYAPSSGYITHTCQDCGVINAIVEGYHLKPITKAEEKKLMKEAGFL